MKSEIVGDARFTDMPKIRQARAISPAKKFLTEPRLFQGVCERMKECLRDENPGSDESEIHAMLRQRYRILRKLEDGSHSA